MSIATQLESLPYVSRELSRSELQRLDVYLYESPKLARRLTVVRPAALALALEFEFTGDVEAFVERPRTLQVDTSRHELSFWTRTRRGLEQFHLLTAYPVGNSGQARAAERKRDAIVVAARQAQIALRLVPEAQFLRRATENANRLRLLPYVQTAQSLAINGDLRERILELFRFQNRNSFHRLEQALSTFDPRDVRAATCGLIHNGRLKIDWSVKLHIHSMLEAEAGP